MVSVVSIEKTIQVLKQGGVVAYPTEAVYGLGCDPNNEKAIKKIMQLKQRSLTKGLIVVGGEFSHIASYIKLKEHTLPQPIKDSWPGPHNWLLPANPSNSNLLTGKYTTQAVRISSHPIIQKLCSLYKGGLISTSANKTNQSPCKTPEELAYYFGCDLIITEGKLGGALKPCEIRHYSSNQVIRE